MESVIGLIIWLVVFIVIISKTIRRVSTQPVEKDTSEGKKENEPQNLFEVIFTGGSSEQEKNPEEQEKVEVVEPEPQVLVSVQPESKVQPEPTQEPEEFQIPKDFRQAIILHEIIGPPKAL